MCSRDPNGLDPELRRRAQCAIRDYKAQHPTEPTPVITCTTRTNEQQAVVWAQGRTAPGAIVTWAEPGQSPHNQVPSAAFDVGFRTPAGPFEWDRPELFERFGRIAQRYGIEWGGDWLSGSRAHHDMCHFQAPGWRLERNASGAVGVPVHDPWPEMPAANEWPGA
jgi:peptidoglycan L-alanyl-D-glutamate endopeptidase CwlK